MGVIGENGAGKTTLLMTLAKIYAPDKGTISVRGKVSSLLEVGAGFRSDLTGRENVFLYGAIMGLSRKTIQREFDWIVDFSGLERFIDAPVRTYSSGMRMRLGFSVAVSVHPDVLLVDEALGIGDAEFQRRSMERIDAFRKQGGTLVFVSHDMDAVGRVCNAGLLLERGRLVSHGTCQDVISTYWERVWGKAVKEKSRKSEEGTDPFHGARRWGSGEIRFLGFEIRNVMEKSIQQAFPGESLTVIIRFVAGIELEKVVFRVAFFHETQPVAVFLSDPAHYPEGSSTGEGIAKLQINSLPLSPGEYKIDLEVHEASYSQMYDHVDKFITFRVSDLLGKQQGHEKVRPIPAVWEIEY